VTHFLIKKWSKKWSRFWTPQKVRIYNFFDRSTKNHQFSHFFRLFSGFWKNHAFFIFRSLDAVWNAKISPKPVKNRPKRRDRFWVCQNWQFWNVT
jgi:hypothetical protein